MNDTATCTHQDITRAQAGEGPWSCSNCHATVSVYVGLQHDRLNLSVFQVTPMSDGMELVEYVGAAGYNVPEDVELKVLTARDMARATGAKSATNRWESRSANGDLVTTATATYYANRWEAPRLAMGLHRAKLTLSPEQAALKAEAATQGEPVKGQRYVVSELSGYQLIQDRPLDHRECGCGDGTTTYAAGTVEGITYWMDNSVEATVRLDACGTCQGPTRMSHGLQVHVGTGHDHAPTLGRAVRVTMKAPSGDACF